jgi:hypothetical protein
MVELYLHSRICLHDIMLNHVIKCRDNFTFTFLNLNYFNCRVRHVPVDDNFLRENINSSRPEVNTKAVRMARK